MIDVIVPEFALSIETVNFPDFTGTETKSGMVVPTLETGDGLISYNHFTALLLSRFVQRQASVRALG